MRGLPPSKVARPVAQATRWIAPRLELPTFFKVRRPRTVTQFPAPARVLCTNGSYAHRYVISRDGEQEVGTCRHCGHVKRYRTQHYTAWEHWSPEDER